jgi:ribbon-helix-helix CopG family protein
LAGAIAVYTYIISRRTQITLDDRQHAFLRDEARRTGLSMAELVRRAVDATYRPHQRPRVAGYELSFGMWRRPDAAMAGRRVRAPN